jgi:acetyl esterase/lipase
MSNPMKMTISAFLAAAAISACACNVEPVPTPADQPGQETPSGEENSGNQNQNPVTAPFSIHYTDDVPSEYFTAASEEGTVEILWYDSKDYTRSDTPATRKPAYVYLPYGYDPSKKYDVIYLLHGWTGVAQEYFLGRSGNAKTNMVRLFDNLIQKGLSRPFIAVSPTWDKDNQAKDWGESTREAAVFSQEYVKDLIPAVETHYSTYLEKADKEGILASRAHRCIGGFSLGSITTWYIFEQAFPYSKWYLPMSGDNWSQGMFGGAYYPDKTAAFLKDIVNKSGYKDDFYVWYAVGTRDVRIDQTHNQALAMAKLTDTFNSTNFSYHQKEGGQHDMNAVWEFIYNALPFIFPLTESNAPIKQTYTTTSKIADIMADPSFGDFGRLLFPVNTGYWSGDTLGDLRLTWYNYINPDKTVEIVNTLKSRADEGQTVFYDIYSDAEKAREPDKRNTGLFFFKGHKGQPFAICNAGGGMAYVGAMHDSFPHALELSKKGYNAFALIYRPGWNTAMEDLAKAISFVISHKDELGVATDGYSLWGGSAGARMAATLGSHAAEYGVPRAGAVIMQYTGHSEWTRSDPPTYACCGTSDGIASASGMKRRLDAMSAAGIPTEFHAYEGLPHGFGLGIGTASEGWIEDAINFWKSNI